MVSLVSLLEFSRRRSPSLGSLPASSTWSELSRDATYYIDNQQNHNASTGSRYRICHAQPDDPQALNPHLLKFMSRL